MLAVEVFCLLGDELPCLLLTVDLLVHGLTGGERDGPSPAQSEEGPADVHWHDGVHPVLRWLDEHRRQLHRSVPCSRCCVPELASAVHFTNRRSRFCTMQATFLPSTTTTFP